MGTACSLLPHLKHLWLYYVISTVESFANGSLDAGGNVLCLDIWRNDNSGPWVHSIHFSFAIGAFLSPILAVPFLDSSEQPNDEKTSSCSTDDHGDFTDRLVNYAGFLNVFSFFPLKKKYLKIFF